MEDNYLLQMQRYENDYNGFLRKADQILEENGNKHSKEECVLLQRAVECQSKMATISIGEEKLYHQRKIRELNRQILVIVKEIDPEAYNRWVNKSKPAAAPKGSSGTAKPAPAPDSEDTLDTESWFAKPPKHSFADVAGMDDLKQYLQEVASDTKTGNLRKYLGLPNLSSFFFYGPPGCGKTYLIEAFVHELMQKDYKYLTLDGSNILSKYVGEAEKIVTKLFAQAEESAPCIIFIDEIDGVCKNRSMPNLPEYASSITTAFLTGYNRIQTTEKPIIFIGATNYPGQVDSAMLDRVELIRISLPDEEHRKFIFEHQMKDSIKLEDALTWEYMVKCTNGYDIRDIKRLINRVKYLISRELMVSCHDEEKAIQALKDGDYVLTKQLFDKAVSENKPTPKDGILRSLDAWENMMHTEQGIGEAHAAGAEEQAEAAAEDAEEQAEAAAEDTEEQAEAVAEDTAEEKQKELGEQVGELSEKIAALIEALQGLSFSRPDSSKDEKAEEPKTPPQKKEDNFVADDMSILDVLSLKPDWVEEE